MSFAVLGQVVIRVLGLIGGLVTVAVQGRALGAADFAALSMLLAIALAGQTLVDLGLGKVATQRVAADPATISVVAGSVVLARLVLGLCAAAAGTVIGGTIAGGGEGFVAALMVCLGLPLSSVTVLQALSEARLDVWAVNTIILVQNGFWLVVVVLLYVLDADLLWFTVGYAVVAVVQAAVVWTLSVRGLPIRIRGMRREALGLLKASVPLGVGALAVTAYYRLTGIILFERTDADTSAGYFAAMRLLDAGQALPATIGGVLLPLLSRALHQGHRAAATAAWDIAVRVQLAAAIVVVAVTVVHAESIVDILFGSSFSGRADELTVLIFAYPAICLGWIVTSGLIAAGELRRYSVAVTVVAVASLAVLAAGIDAHQAPWAAAVTLTTEWISVGVLSWLLARRVGLVLAPSVVLRVVVLGSCVAGVCLAAKDWGLLPGVLLAGVIALALTSALRLVTPSAIREALKARQEPDGSEEAAHVS